ncbi:hypothetical protein [Anabaena sp. CCY 0017]
MTRRYALQDDQWQRIKDLLTGREGFATEQKLLCDRTNPVLIPLV